MSRHRIARAATAGAALLTVLASTSAHAASASHSVTCSSGQTAHGKFNASAAATWRIWATYSDGQNGPTATYAMGSGEHEMTVPGTAGFSVRTLHAEVNAGSLSAVGTPGCRSSQSATTGNHDIGRAPFYGDTVSTVVTVGTGKGYPWLNPLDSVPHGGAYCWQYECG